MCSKIRCDGYFRKKFWELNTPLTESLEPSAGSKLPTSIGGPGLAPGVRSRTDLPNAGLANVAATVMNLHGFQAPDHYEPTLVEVVDK